MTTVDFQTTLDSSYHGSDLTQDVPQMKHPPYFHEKKQPSVLRRVCSAYQMQDIPKSPIQQRSLSPETKRSPLGSSPRPGSPQPKQDTSSLIFLSQKDPLKRSTSSSSLRIFDYYKKEKKIQGNYFFENVVRDNYHTTLKCLLLKCALEHGAAHSRTFVLTECEIQKTLADFSGVFPFRTELSLAFIAGLLDDAKLYLQQGIPITQYTL